MNAIGIPSPSTCGLDLAVVVADSAAAPMVMPGLALRAELEPDDVGRLGAISADEAHRLEQLLAVDDGARRVGRRQHLLVVGELAVDQPADEVDALEVEEDLVLGPGRA